MKKTMKALLAILLAAATLFAMSACSFGDLEGESTIELSADNLQDSMQLIDQFFEKTLKAENYIVTLTDTDGKVSRTEIIAGETEKSIGESVTMYIFVKDGEYIVASDMGDVKMVTKNKAYYEAVYKNFFRLLDSLREMKDDEYEKATCTFKTLQKTKGETVLEESGEITFDLKAEGATIHVTGSEKDGLVQQYSMKVDSDEQGLHATAVYTFEYKKGEIEIPDISDWNVTNP